MKRICLNLISCLAASMLIGSSSCLNANSTSDTFEFDKSGIASVRVGDLYTSVPNSYPGLYSRAEYRVSCGSEDSEGVDILYYDDTSEDFIICAMLNVDQTAINTLYERELECNNYPITDTQIGNVLQQSGSTTIVAIMVAPSPLITVNINGQDMATNEPARKFMEMPGAVTTAAIGEGIYLSCTIGDLTMTLMNAYDALAPDALSRICEKLANEVETGRFAPVPVSASDVNPEVQFDYFSY